MNRRISLRRVVPSVVHVCLPSGDVKSFSISKSTTGGVIMSMLNSIFGDYESHYFGLNYLDSQGSKCWLRLEKPIAQECSLQDQIRLNFDLRIYPICTDLSFVGRHMLTLVLKKRMLSGSLTTDKLLLTLLSSLLIKVEFTEEEFSQLESIPVYFPDQDESDEIMMNSSHADLHGISGKEAQARFLAFCSMLESYDSQYYPANNGHLKCVLISVSYGGIKVLSRKALLRYFVWDSIRKLAFDGRSLIVKLSAGPKFNMTFVFSNGTTCRIFWKLCVDYHAFYVQSSLDRSED